MSLISLLHRIAVALIDGKLQGKKLRVYWGFKRMTDGFTNKGNFGKLRVFNFMALRVCPCFLLYFDELRMFDFSRYVLHPLLQTNFECNFEYSKTNFLNRQNPFLPSFPKLKNHKI